MRTWFAVLGVLLTVGCSRGPSTSAAAAQPAPAPAAPKLGIRPNGDTEIQPDLAKIENEDLKKVFKYIDEHIDDHVVNLQKWIRQPSISNSGEGIPEGDGERVFEAFYRGDAARGEDGAGLGLAISKAIVEAHGGRIWLEDGMPGTRVHFTLKSA